MIIVSAIGIILIGLIWAINWYKDIGIAHIKDVNKIQTKFVKYSPLGIYIPKDNIDLIKLDLIGLENKYETSGTILPDDDYNKTWVLVKKPVMRWRDVFEKKPETPADDYNPLDDLLETEE